MAVVHSELHSNIRDMIIIIGKMSDNISDERDNLKSLLSISTGVSNFLDTAGLHDKKHSLHQGLRALIEAVKKKEASSVDSARVNLAALMKDIVQEVKVYFQNESSKSKRNTPLPHRTDIPPEHLKQGTPIHDALEAKRNAPAGLSVDVKRSMHIANAPPLHQEIKRNPLMSSDYELKRSPSFNDTEVKRQQSLEEPSKKHPVLEDLKKNDLQISTTELRRTDSSSLDAEQAEQSVTGWLRLITYLSSLQAEAR